MRFYILAALAALVLISAMASIFVYDNWRQSRYDNIIIEKAEKYDLPPALIKAMIKSWSNFFIGRRPDGMGLMSVPVEGLAAYERVKMTRPYGFVCLNQHKPPHKKYPFEKSERCPICGSLYIEEYFYPETNIEIGAWYLDFLRDETEKQLVIKASSSLELALYAYRFGVPRLNEETNDFTNALLTERMRFDLSRVLALWNKYKGKRLK